MLFIIKLYVKYSIVCVYLICTLGLKTAVADSQCTTQIRGINLAGAEFGAEYLRGVEKTWYMFPTLSHLKYYKKMGFNAVRLPVAWELLQPDLFREFDKSYSESLMVFMDQAASQGFIVVVDLHNYARFRKQLIGTSAVPSKAFRDIWSRLARLLYKHPALYAYGLMNEPHHTEGLWHAVAQYGIDGIREVDPEHYIYVSGDDWSSAASWPKTNPEPFVKDTANKIIYEAHVYFDDNFSGRYQTPLGNVDLEGRVKSRLEPFLAWLVKHHQKGVIGEWGVPTDDLEYKLAVDSFSAITKVSCLDWFIWTGGPVRSSSKLLLAPKNGVNKPMLDYVKKLML